MNHVTLSERSLAAPALTSWRDQLCLGWTGTDLHLNVLVTPDGRTVQDKVRLHHTSYRTETKSGMNTSSGFSETKTIALAPSLAASETDVDLAWTESNWQLSVIRGQLGGQATPLPLDERSHVAPAVTRLGEDLVLVWVGTDRHINVRFRHGDSVRLEETSNHAPAVCVVGEQLLVAWTGTDRRLNVMPFTDDAVSSPIHLEETSSDGPALCAVGPTLALAWTGSDRRLNVIRSEDGHFGEPLTLDEKSSYAPAVCERAGSLFIAWTGTDSRLNLAVVGA